VEQLFDGGPVVRRREILRDLAVELFDLADHLRLGPAVDDLAAIDPRVASVPGPGAGPSRNPG
jgi:hypothetical protein